jgi:hypothetical protein
LGPGSIWYLSTSSVIESRAAKIVSEFHKVDPGAVTEELVTPGLFRDAQFAVYFG